MKFHVFSSTRFVILTLLTATAVGTVISTSGQDIEQTKQISKLDEKMDTSNKILLRSLEEIIKVAVVKLSNIETDVRQLKTLMTTQTNLVNLITTLDAHLQSLVNNTVNLYDQFDNSNMEIGKESDAASEVLKVLKRNNVSETSDRSMFGPSQLVHPFPNINNVGITVNENILEDLLTMDIENIDSVNEHNLKTFNYSTRGHRRVNKISDLFKRIWKKFTRPLTNVEKNFTTLADNGGKLLDTCQEVVTKLNKVEEAIRNSLTRDSGRDQPCSKELAKVSQRFENKIENLEQKINYQIALTEKLFDKISTTDDNVSVLNADDEPPDHTDSIDKLYASDCSEFQKYGFTSNDVYKIHLYHEEVIVYCDLITNGGGWTVIQRRGLFNGKQPQNFNQNWKTYKSGFGDLRGEFWLGNDKLHKLTDANDVVLRVELEDFDGNRAFAEYELFSVESETQNYRLHVGGYKGNASNSLIAHNEKLFSTSDRINDEVDPCCSCSLTFEGGWWFYACFESHLNGPYFSDPLNNGYYRGIIWEHWKGDYSLKASEMKIRPKQFMVKSSQSSGRYNVDDVDDP